MDRPDRRRYFRINDWVGLSYRPIDLEEIVTQQKEASNVQVSAVDVLKSIDQELTAALNALWQSNPTVASAIGLLNKKMDIIAVEADLDYAHIKGLQTESHEVNISACGMAFESKDRFDTGQLLELNVLLKPANTHVRLIGRVMDCEQSDESDTHPYFLRLDFDQMDAEVQEQLIQHIVRRQSSQLGNDRQD